MIQITDKSKCTGCSACFNACPKHAISLIEDAEGFSYPYVSHEKCIDCSACEQVCPIISTVTEEKDTFERPIVLAVRNKDDMIRINSTSGGAFSALAEEVLAQDGVVVGAEYTSDFSIQHVIINNLNSIQRLRQSKYAQSCLSDVFIKVKQLLKKEKTVLFCGTPCQIAGLKKYLRKDYQNLILCDFICRGIISQKVYHKYLQSVESHTGSKIDNIQFKNKDFGWNRFSTKITLQDGIFYHKDRYNDEYMLGYLKYNLYLRPACYECKFKSLPRISDITLGDFWGVSKKDIQLDDNKGTSVVLLNSSKGEKLFFSAAKTRMSFTECCIDDVTRGNYCLLNVTPRGRYRDYFFGRFEKDDFIELIHKIEQKAIWDRTDLSLKDRLYLIKKRIFSK